ncbi:MAG: PadR family transcriptional regulator [Acidimicrobiales bacterium]
MHRHDHTRGDHEHGTRERSRRYGPWWEDWGPEWGGPPMRGGGRRMRRGDIRIALLAALEEGPAHGYEIINRLEEKSGGTWRPSPGSVYPTLQMFEDEGLVKSEEREGKRVYQLTDAGRAEAEQRSQRRGGPPWEDWAREGLHEGLRGLRKAAENLGPLFRPLMMAMRQVAMEGDSSKLERASEVLRKATKELYQILSED